MIMRYTNLLFTYLLTYITRALQCIGMQPFSHSSELLAMSCCCENVMLISQMVQELSLLTDRQIRKHTQQTDTQTHTTENNITFAARMVSMRLSVSGAQ